MFLQRPVPGKSSPRPAPQPSENLLAKPTFLLEKLQRQIVGISRSQFGEAIRELPELPSVQWTDSVAAIRIQLECTPTIGPTKLRITRIIPLGIQFDSSSRLYCWSYSSKYCSSRWNYSSHLDDRRKCR